MRRIDLHPAKRLRNPGRHLRQLQRWPGRIADVIPANANFTGYRFWNFKVPVFAKLVDPPHATPETQRACLAAIFAAADALEHSPRRPAPCRIACLVTTPFLFQSEVTLFFEEDYFRTFLPAPQKKRTTYEGGWIEAEPQDLSEIAPLLPATPAGLEFCAGTLVREFEDGSEEPYERSNWVWSFPRR